MRADDYASDHGIPLGAAISELLRRVETTTGASSATLTTSKRGLLIKQSEAGRVKLKW